MRNLALVAALACALASCADNDIPRTGVANTVCNGGVAQIGIQDGSTQILCGCNEPAAGLVLPPATLTCTVPAGTTVFFHFIAIRALHQLIPAGTPAIAPSTLEKEPRSHAVILSTPGSYRFEDSIDSRLSGVIVVQ